VERYHPRPVRARRGLGTAGERPQALTRRRRQWEHEGRVDDRELPLERAQRAGQAGLALVEGVAPGEARQAVAAGEHDVERGVERADAGRWWRDLAMLDETIR
jgi:hypothetical protein